MNELTVDIETIPQDNGELAESHILKKIIELDTPDTISLADLQKIDDGEKVEEIKSEFIKKMALNPLLGKIVCISVKIDDGRPRSLTEWKLGTEKALLEKFWAGIDTIYQKNGSRPPFIITKNGKGFDLHYIFVRSVLNNINKPSWLKTSDYLRRYSFFPHYDVQEAQTNYRWDINLPLNVMADVMGIDYIPSYGSEVYDFYHSGRKEEISKHCESDVNATYEMYRIFSRFFK